MWDNFLGVSKNYDQTLSQIISRKLQENISGIV